MSLDYSFRSPLALDGSSLLLQIHFPHCLGGKENDKDTIYTPSNDGRHRCVGINYVYARALYVRAPRPSSDFNTCGRRGTREKTGSSSRYGREEAERRKYIRRGEDGVNLRLRNVYSLVHEVFRLPFCFLQRGSLFLYYM